MTSEQADGLRSVCVALGAHRFLDKAGMILTLEDEVLGLLKDLTDICRPTNGFEAV